MRYKLPFLWVLSAFVALSAGIASGQDELAKAFAGYDLHLQADKMAGQQQSTARYTAVFSNNFSMATGSNQFTADRAIVQIDSIKIVDRGIEKTDYKCLVYLEGNVQSTVGKFSKSVYISSKEVFQGQGLVLRFLITGQVYATASSKQTINIEDEMLYHKAMPIFKEVDTDRPKLVVQAGAEVPKIERMIDQTQVKLAKARPVKTQPIQPQKKEEDKGLFEAVFGQKKKEPVATTVKLEPEEPEPKFTYPVNISSVGAEPLKLESQKVQADGGVSAATITGRFYLWQKIGEGNKLLELLADNAVVFYAGNQVKLGEDTGDENLAATGAVQSIYLQGNVEMTEGSRTIRADEFYYDFQRKQGLAINAVMRSFDPKRGIPIYIRAKRLRQVAQDKFEGEEVLVTNSEFYKPQLNLNASRITITDTTYSDQQQGKVSESSYELDMRDIRMKYNNFTFFYWPRLKTNMERPDVPLKTVHVSRDGDFGTSIETRWHLCRLLGLREPNGVESTLALDYFGDRGTGFGVDFDYEGDEYHGRILSYLIHDSGEDDLGRTRQNLEPDKKLRGRFRWQHRQYLPDDWQLTMETSYSSDRNFIEGFYRSEFNTGKEQETIVHLKQTRDNRSLSILAKVRINDFVDKLEELPTIEYHLTGQSVFDDRLTLFSDSRLSRLKNRYEDGSFNDSDPDLHENFYTFATTRAELDWPMVYKRTKIVPYIAGMFGYDDLYGFNTTLGGGAADSQRDVIIGEFGIRAATQFWKVNPTIQNKFWDINGIRHIIKPHIEAAIFAESDDTAEQRDIINVGLLQRWQTKRGPDNDIIDWMRLSIDATFVSNDEDNSTGPDKFIWNRPLQPLFFRKDSDNYGIRRDVINADYLWRITDTTTFLSDINYDIKSGTVGQLDVGFAHYRYPDLSYYIGSRYLNNFVEPNSGERGSHALLYAITYKLNQRYALVFSQEYNFDYGKSIESELTIIRRYHRVYYALSFNTDSSLDRSGMMLSIWPEGIKEFGLGSRKFFGLTGSSSNY